MHPAITLTSLAAFAAAAGLAVAQPSGNKPQGNSRTAARNDRPAERAQPESPTGDVLYLYSAGLHELLSSPKDQGLRNALDLLPARLVELAELGGAGMDGGPDPEKVINLMWTLAESPFSMRLAATEPGENGEPPIALAIESSPEDAEALERAIVSMVRESGGPTFRTVEGGREFDTPMGPGRLGQTEHALALTLGQALPPVDHDFGLPAGYTAAFAMHLNLRNAQPMIEMALSQSPEADQARPMLEQSGILGEDALVIDMAMGHNGTESVVRGTAHDLRPRAAALGIPADVTLDSEFLSLIPADATYVSAGVFSLASMEQMLEMPEVQEGLEQVNEQFGIDVQADIIEQIGNRFAIYQSDTTGGGGMLSMVAVLELNDGAQFARAHRRLTNAFNDFAAEQAAGMTQGFGGVEIRPRRADGVEFFTLTWPGLPIPAEISWTIHGDHLMFALSPRSLISAMGQASDPDGSFAGNDAVAAVTGHGDAGEAELITLTYTDAPRFAVTGYSMVNLLCAAASNALRSPDGADPGIPLPAFNDFMDGIEPNVTVTHWDGDDLRIAGRADASMLVNLAGSSGAALGPLAVGGFVAAALPAMGEAREAARQTKSMSQLRQIAMAVHIHAADHQDDIPDSLDEMMEYLGDASVLSSPMGPCYDGSPDYGFRTDLADSRLTDLADPATTMAVIDRATVINGNEMVLVAFFDGHVEAVYSWQLSDLLAHEDNRGAFEAFGLPEWLNPGF